jgi:transcriptional regulator PpsR
MSQDIQEHTGHRFESPGAFLSGLDAEAAAALVTAAADVVLVVDGEGVIRDMAVGNEELTGYREWLGRPWVQTVTVESRPKIEAMLQDVGRGRSSKWRQVNHPGVQGNDLPLSYTVVPVRPSGGRADSQPTHSMAFGRDLRPQAAMQQRVVSAQLSMERDYWRLRHFETRYRLLFQVVSEPVLILDAVTERLEEANPAAVALLGGRPPKPGWSLTEHLDERSAQAVRDAFVQLRTSGRFEPMVVRVHGVAEPLTLSASLFRQESVSHFLVRLTGAQAVERGPHVSHTQALPQLMERAPDGFVVTDLQGRILTANRAFLDLSQLATEELVRGQSLGRWLGRSDVDLNVLISNLRQRGAVRLFATRVRGEYGSIAEVEISAVAVTEGETPCLGFCVRDVGPRLSSDTRSTKELPRSADQMTELVGRVPLKDIVRETTDLIEQLCIEAALELTGDNRASAAEMLGLSRQSLYVKLRRFGIGDGSGEVPEA